jgi:hypothetical protein
MASEDEGSDADRSQPERHAERRENRPRSSFATLSFAFCYWRAIAIL